MSTAAIIENMESQERANKSGMGLLIVEGGFDDQVHPTRESFELGKSLRLTRNFVVGRRTGVIP